MGIIPHIFLDATHYSVSNLLIMCLPLSLSPVAGWAAERDNHKITITDAPILK